MYRVRSLSDVAVAACCFLIWATPHFATAVNLRTLSSLRTGHDHSHQDGHLRPHRRHSSNAAAVDDAALANSLAKEGDRSSIERFSLSNAQVVTNNLGGFKGTMPKTTSATELPQELRYTKVARVGGVDIDLVIANTSKYMPKDKEKPGNGIKGVCGFVNVKAGTSVDLRFRFEDHGTGFPVEMHDFFFSFLDADHAKRGTADLIVKLEPGLRYHVLSDSTIEVDPNDEGWMSFHTTDLGIASPGLPEDPMYLTKEQERRAVSLRLSNISEFTARLSVKTGGSLGRNFTFMGATSLVTPSEEHLNFEIVGTPSTLKRLTESAESRLPVLREDSVSDSATANANLTSYWDYKGCGPAKAMHNTEWCMPTTGDAQVSLMHSTEAPAPHTPSCKNVVEVSEDVCSPGVAYLDRIVGKGTEWSILRDGCIYAYFAQYRCDEFSTDAKKIGGTRKPGSFKPYKMGKVPDDEPLIPTTTSSGLKGPWSEALRNMIDPKRPAPPLMTTTGAPLAALYEPQKIEFTCAFLYAPVISAATTASGVRTAKCRSGWAPVMNEMQLLRWAAERFNTMTAAVTIKSVRCVGEPLAQEPARAHPCDAGLFAPVAVSYVITAYQPLTKPVTAALQEMAGSAGATTLSNAARYEAGAFAACSGLIVGTEDRITPLPELPVQVPANYALQTGKDAAMAADAAGKSPTEVALAAANSTSAAGGSDFEVATVAANAAAQMARERRASDVDILRFALTMAGRTGASPSQIAAATGAVGAEMAIQDWKSPREVAKQAVDVAVAAGGTPKDVAHVALDAAVQSATYRNDAAVAAAREAAAKQAEADLEAATVVGFGRGSGVRGPVVPPVPAPAYAG